MKTSIIKIPKGFQIKEVKGNKIILGKKGERLTYEEVAEKLFAGDFLYISGTGEILRSATNFSDPTNVTSERQGEKLLAINKLMNVAKYLNSDWQPDWNHIGEAKYTISFDPSENKLVFTGLYTTFPSNNVYFRTRELAKKAVEILGEETIKLTLCTDY